jgi:hypothetical protein
MRPLARALIGVEMAWSRFSARVLAGALLVAAVPACKSEKDVAEGTAQAAPRAPEPAVDTALQRCKKEIAAFEAEPALPGAPEFERQRVEILGRAHGEPVLFAREPAETPDAELTEAARLTRASLARATGYSRVKSILARHRGDKSTLRALLLRQGYLYSSDPHEALALVLLLDLTKLFDEPTIYRQRGAVVSELHRTSGRFAEYRDEAGRTADLILGDRVATSRAGLEHPLHRDLRALSREMGFDRAKIERYSASHVLASLRFGGAWVRSLMKSDGAELSLDCFDANDGERRRIQQWIDSDAPRRKALAALHRAVDEEVTEAIPFDRPRGEHDEDRDGQLRPEWRWAYLHGMNYFSFDDASYPVFDAKGRPLPPQMCVDFVLDSFERSAGSWYRERGPDTGRFIGHLDFNAFGIKNRRSVLAFEKFAEDHPDIFEHERFQPEERIPFAERDRFFAYLREHADRFRPGDVVAIQGKKDDGNIHQHAILIEDTDPVTGFPDELADQMSRPRRRTWEAIMGPAPLRSLLYHVRLRSKALLSLAE